MQYLLQILVAVDQTGNAVLGGYADETISSRCWRLSGSSRAWSIARRVIDALARLFGQRDHCFDAYVSEQLRRQFPPELRRLDHAPTSRPATAPGFFLSTGETTTGATRARGTRASGLHASDAR